MEPHNTALLRDHDVMTCQAFMSASDDCLLESEVRRELLAPRSGFELTTHIVAATDRLQAFRFPQSSRQGIVEFALVCSDRACQGKQVQAFRCYEHNPSTFRRLLTNFRAAGCPLLPKRILRCCRTDQGRLFYMDFAGAKAACRKEQSGEE
jgi:hypothetical protein